MKGIATKLSFVAAALVMSGVVAGAQTLTSVATVNVTATVTASLAATDGNNMNFPDRHSGRRVLDDFAERVWRGQSEHRRREQSGHYDHRDDAAGDACRPEQLDARHRQLSVLLQPEQHEHRLHADGDRQRGDDFWSGAERHGQRVSVDRRDARLTELRARRSATTAANMTDTVTAP